MKRRMNGVFVWVAFFLVLLASGNAQAAKESGTWGNNLTWELDTDTGYLELSGSGEMAHYDPFDTPWYAYLNQIKNVVVNDGVTSITQTAFAYSQSLKSVSLPASLVSIEPYAFHQCKNLVSVNIPSRIVAIEEAAFAECESLSEISFPESVMSIETLAFVGCKSLKTVDILSVRLLGRDAFAGCDNLESVAMGTLVETLGSNLFAGCNSLTSVTINTSSAPAFGQFTFGQFNDDAPVAVYVPQGSVSDYQAKLPGVTVVAIGQPRPPLSKIVSFSFLGSQDPAKDVNIPVSAGVRYEDSYFSEGSYAYNHELAKMSLALALSAFNSSDAPSRNYDKDVAGKNVYSLMKSVGLGNIDISSYQGAPTTSSIGVAFGHKLLSDGATLIAIADRGGGYEKEWAGNFNITGKKNHHDGFQEAAEAVVSKLISYISAQSLTGKKVKIWIAGYSRAAATANLVASELNDGILTSVSLNRNDLYAYTFETPRNTKASSAARNDKHLNIFNFVNPLDPVPMVPLSGWGYTRYGVDCTFPSADTTHKYADLQFFVTQKYNRYSGKNLSAPPYISGQAALLSDLFFNLACLTYPNDRSPSAQYILKIAEKNAATIFGESGAAEKALTGFIDIGAVKRLWLVNALDILRRPYILKTEVLAVKVFFNGGTVFASHEPELTLAWMLTLKGKEDLSSTKYRKVLVACPVDIEVYDSANTLVAQIVNDTILPVPGSFIGGYTYENESGEMAKVVVLPSDEEYSIKILATDDGIMTYEVSEHDVSEERVGKIIAYDNVQITQGDEMVGLVENLDSVSASYSLHRVGGESLTPDRTSATAVASDKKNLTWDTIKNANISTDCVISELMLPPFGFSGSAIVWSSSDESIISISGEVTRPASGSDRMVTLAATIVLGDAVDTVAFDLIVSALPGSKSGGSSTIFYTVSFETSGGSAISNQKVAAGRKLAKPVDPQKKGFAFEEWYVDKALTEVYDFEETVFGNINLYAKWSEIMGMDVKWQNPFLDVESTDWYYDAVKYAFENNIMRGTSIERFDPNAKMSRAMLVQVLYNLEDQPATGITTFDDVERGAWYYSAIAWAADNAIVSGIGSNLFAPTADITREQMAVMLYNYCIFKEIELPSIREKNSFADSSSVSSWAAEAVHVMYQANVLNGKGNDIFDPQGTATRAEAAQMFMSFKEKTQE